MFTTQGLFEQLQPCMDAPVWWLGLSGGLDSMVLLDALVQLRQLHSLPQLKAIHVHHGLHADADQWVAHCVHECAARQVPLTVERVQLAPGASIEAAARDARYNAMTRHLQNAEVLLLAHHRDDQLETMLFRMLRGTGVKGLAGMPRQRVLGAGLLRRPLLGWSRAELEQWADSRNLCWIDDPANADGRFARTTLRHEVVPLLRQHWPALDGSMMRLSEHIVEANELLDERAAEDLLLVQPGVGDAWLSAWSSLSVEGLLRLSEARRNNLLRYWLYRHGRRLPEHRHMQALEQQLLAAGDSQPVIRIDDYQLCRSSGRLWLLPGHGLPAGVDQPLPRFADTSLQAGNGVLRMRPGVGGLRRCSGDWRVAYRQGGEQIRLPGRPSRPLKQLLQEAGVPVWLRPAIPLLYCDGQLVSVGGRWTAEEACATEDESGWQVVWEPVSQ